MEKIRLGIVGLGQRGSSMMKSVVFKIEDYEVVAVCDFYEDRVADAAKLCEERYGAVPFSTTDYKELLKKDDVDAVYVACSWEYHTPVAIDALRAGKAVAMEVGGAYSVEEMFELVKAYEETGTPFMFMENCCFGRNELLATNMARKGVFGEIVHLSGAYSHDLRQEIAEGNIIRHYRLRNYTSRNCENYPTHELGPIAKIININRGNRMVSLVSVASKARGMEQYLSDHPELIEKDPTLEGRRFKQGDIVQTIITCAGGETILLKLDTTLPRSYSREFTVRGTKGYYMEDANSVFLDGDKESWDAAEHTARTLNSAKKYEEEYLHRVWRDLTEEEIKSGHGGIDVLEFRCFADCLLNGEEMPLDVYDAASWMSICALSAQSVAEGGCPKAIPDFTGGKWLIREPLDVVKFS